MKSNRTKKQTLDKQSSAKHFQWSTAKEALKFLLPIGGFALIVSIIIALYDNFLVMPKISYSQQDDMDIFSVQTDFRGISLGLHPQLLVRLDDHIIYIAHLARYYETETLLFGEERKVSVKRIHQESCDELRLCIRQEIMIRLKELYDDEDIDKIEQNLYVYPSLLAGVEYTNRLRNTQIKFSIIEKNGLFKDYPEGAEEIKNRLNEDQIVLYDSLTETLENIEIDHIADIIAGEIGQYYDDNSNSK